MISNRFRNILIINKSNISCQSFLVASLKRIILINFSLLLFILYIPLSYAHNERVYPLTAHGNYDQLTKHGGLTWTSENVLGKNVLVINSYHKGDNKTDAIMQGIFDQFEESGEPVLYYIEYLDVKRFPYKYHKENLRNVYKYKYANKRLNVIIVNGFEALTYVLQVRSEIFHSTPIVFSGIDNFEYESIGNHEKIYGIIESDDIIATIDLALNLHANANKVILLAPQKQNKNIINKLKNNFNNRAQFIYWNDNYLSDIEKKIESLDKNVVILPISEPRTKAGSSIPYEKFITRIAKINEAPVYILRDTALGTGAIGGKVVSSNAQGSSTAKLALQVINGKNINDSPIIWSSPNEYMFDYLQLLSFGIKNTDLPKDSKIINKPFSVYDEYHTEINLAIVILAIQAGIIFLLLFINKKRKKAENELKTVNDELEIRVANRTEEIFNANVELRRYEQIVSSTNDYISFIDNNYIYRAVNKTHLDAFQLCHEDMIGYTVEKVHGSKRFIDIIKPNVDRCFNGETVNIQYWENFPKIGRKYMDVVYSPYFENNIVMGAVVSARDITPTHELSEKLSYQASHDALTGLINRREFEQRLQRVLKSVKTNNENCVLCYMDLDQFKVINDTCGHAAGDELLHQLGILLKENIRHRDTLARLGGDEFAALLEHCSLNQAQTIINKILNIINEFRFKWGNKSFRVGVSIGVVPITRKSGDLDQLLIQADAACYVAKNEGRNRIHIYQHNDAILEKHHVEMQWITEIQDALENDNFCLYKQAILPVNANQDSGEYFEVLIRMQKDGELISPCNFLPSAEQYGLANKIDEWVISHVFDWLSEDELRQDTLSMCMINISGYSIAVDGFLNFILDKLDNSSITPEKICFEITETVAIANYIKASHFIKELSNRGCCFSLDDFGTGFSSFGHLKNLDVDFLKIDGTFVKDIMNDPIAFSMVKAINEIGHLFELKSIAEFVENDQILEKLKEINIDFVQGYGIGMPQPIEEPLELITKKACQIYNNNSRLQH